MNGLIDIAQHREDIILLWHECFGDSREYIEFFLDNCPDIICVGSTVSDRLVSMLFLLDGRISEYCVKYLYAACTSPEFRGRGLMSGLIEFSEKYCAEIGSDGIFLVPAEKSLYSYYEKFGFGGRFERLELTLKTDGGDCEAVMTKLNCEEAAELREELLDGIDCFSLTSNSYYAVKEHLYCSGEIGLIKDENEKLLIFSNREGKNIVIKEILSSKKADLLKLSKVFLKYQAENVYIRAPIVYNDKDIGVNGTKCGMCFALNSELERLIISDRIFYPGLYLD